MSIESEVNIEETDEESCLACDLVSEFKLMLDADVNWESALRHVLHVALDTKDEIIADLVDEVYTTAFSEGLSLGINKAAGVIYDLVETTEKEIEAVYAERDAELNGEINVAEETEEIEDISDEEFDKYEKLIREDQGRN